MRAEIAQCTARVLTKIRKRMLQPLRIEMLVKDDGVDMSWHDHVGIGAKGFFSVAIGEAVGDDAASGVGDEDGQPLDDRVS